MNGSAWIRAVIEEEGFCLRRDVPRASATLSRLVADGELITPLRGVYIRADDPRLATRLRAVCALFPDAVVAGRAAAAVDYWPELEVGTIEVRRPKLSLDQPGWSFTRHAVPPALLRRLPGMRITDPSLTTLDLCDGDLGSDAIDEALRRRATTVHRLHTALQLTPCRRGNVARTAMLINSHGNPWSAAERLAHRLLRDAGITGWVGNLRVVVRSDRSRRVRFIDIAFPEHRLAIEIDKDQFHAGPAERHQDRVRHNELIEAGWTVVHVDWQMLHEPGYFIGLVRSLLGIHA